jgi:hypothetical protein
VIAEAGAPVGSKLHLAVADPDAPAVGILEQAAWASGPLRRRLTQ